MVRFVEDSIFAFGKMKHYIAEHSFYDDDFSPNPVIIDLGAGRGDFTYECVRRFNPQLILAVEPQSIFPELSYECVKDYQCVVSDKDNLDLNFYVDVVNDECSSLLFPTRTGVTMLSRTLESLIIENSLQEIDLLKIDIEGAEWGMLINTPDYIFKKIKQITCEFHDFLMPSKLDDTLKCINRLSALGFKVETNPIPGIDNTTFYDVIFKK